MADYYILDGKTLPSSIEDVDEKLAPFWFAWIGFKNIDLFKSESHETKQKWAEYSLNYRKKLFSVGFCIL